MTDNNYECPVLLFGGKKCKYPTSRACDMRTHIVTAYDFEAHQAWLRQNNLDLYEMNKSGDYSPLMDVIEKKCKII